MAETNSDFITKAAFEAYQKQASETITDLRAQIELIKDDQKNSDLKSSTGIAERQGSGFSYTCVNTHDFWGFLRSVSC